MPAQSNVKRHPMRGSRSSFASGTWVQIKRAANIVATLDERGCVDGIPFMPEMVPFCGKVFAVQNVANNVCHDGKVHNLDGCAILRMRDRCSGAAHGGCQFACQFFWRFDWLDVLNDAHSGNPAWERPDGNSLAELKRIAQASVQPDGASPTIRFRCQATAIGEVAPQVSASRIRQYRNLYRDKRASIKELVQFFGYLASKKIHRRSDSLAGPHRRRTPTEPLNLKVGDRVCVKPIQEIQRTLDQNGNNRGLWFDRDEMAQYCGKELSVSRRVERIIDERTGELLDLKTPSIVLSETTCSGLYRRFCSRGMFFLWRECWLQRVD